jgi:hypothetical protein
MVILQRFSEYLLLSVFDQFPNGIIVLAGNQDIVQPSALV